MKLCTINLLLSFSLCVFCCVRFTKDRNQQRYKVVCYYDGRSGETSNGLLIENIDACLCTHIIYKFAVLDNGYTLRAQNPTTELNNDSNQHSGLYQRFNNLKKKNPNLSTMISVGGGDEDFNNYVQLMRNQELRSLFAVNVVHFLTAHGFDGLDIGWSYPSTIQDPRTIINNYVLLLRELFTQFESHGLILSASISGFQEQIDTFYNIAGISDYVDFINVAAFVRPDGPIRQTTPLFSKQPEIQQHSISHISDYLLDKHANPRKLVIGLPEYGVYAKQTTTTTVQQKHSGNTNEMVQLINYNQICLQAKTTNVSFDSVSHTAFFQKDGLISFDNTASFIAKIKFIRDQRLGGVMMYSLEMDDYSGECGQGKFPLTSTAQYMNLRPICNGAEAKETPIAQIYPRMSHISAVETKG